MSGEEGAARGLTELVECIRELRRGLSEHIRIVDAVIAVLVEHESAGTIRKESTKIDSQVASALVPMFQALGSSSHSLGLLSQEIGLETRDCFSIVRSVVETAVNVCYIISEGSAAANRAQRHARQKAYRDLERESEVAGSTIRVTYGDVGSRQAPDDLQGDLAEFTSNRGREKGWTDLSVDARIARLAEGLDSTVATRLHFARFMVYRHSSEILHGTLFGTLYFWGLTSPNPSQTPDDFERHIGELLMMVLLTANLSISATIRAFHLKYGFQNAEVQSTGVIDRLGAIPYLNWTQEEE